MNIVRPNYKELLIIAIIISLVVSFIMQVRLYYKIVEIQHLVSNLSEKYSSH